LAVRFGDDTLQLYDVKTGEPKWKTKKEKISFNGYKFSPDGKTLVVKIEDNILQLYDVKKGQFKWEIRKEKVFDCEFSPDSSKSSGQVTLAVTFKGDTLQLYDVKTGQSKWKEESACGCEFSPDGKTFAVKFRGGALQLYDVEKGQSKWKRKKEKVFDCEFSPDGNTLAVVLCSDTFQLCDVKTGQLKWKKDDLFSYSYKFSPDGKTLVMKIEDDTLQLYDVENGQPKWKNKMQNVRGCRFFKDPKMGIKLFVVTFDKWTKELEVHTYLFPDKELLISREDLKDRIGFLKEVTEVEKEFAIRMVNRDGTPNSKPITLWRSFLI